MFWPGQPHLDVVGLLRRKTHIAGAQGHDAIVQTEPPQDLLGAGQHALVFVLRLLRRRDGDELDFGELMLADHAARVLAGGAGFGTEAGRAGSEPHRQLRFVDDGFAHEIGERHFGGGDEPETIFSGEYSDHSFHIVVSFHSASKIRRKDDLTLLTSHSRTSALRNSFSVSLTVYAELIVLNFGNCAVPNIASSRTNNGGETSV